MKQQIKVGDKVKCLQSGKWIEAGKVYTVYAISKMGYIYLKEPFLRGGYVAENFVRVPLRKAGVKLPLGYRVVQLKLAKNHPGDLLGIPQIMTGHRRVS